MTRSCKKIALFLFLFSFVSIVFFVEDVFGYGLYYRTITINNTQNPNNLTNYQVLVIVDTQTPISQGKMRSDCGDIRFVDSDGVTLLTHYIYTNITNYTGLSYSWGIFRCNSTQTMIRVVVPSIPANSMKTIYMFYGNSSLTYNNQLSNIFSDTIGVMSATLPSGRIWFSCAPYGDSIYCFGGYNGSRLNQIVRYNVTNNSVTVMSATLPSGRESLACAPHGDSIYCFGGYDGSYLNQIVRYNITSDTVTIMSATLPNGRYALSCVPYGDSIYCFGGYSESGLSNQIVRYNITSNTVTVMSATLPSGREGLSCSPYRDSIYCFGGFGVSYINQIVRYNITSNIVIVMSATLPSGRRLLSCSPYGDSIYCFGGWDGSYINQIVRYNITSDTVTIMNATLPSGRRGLSCSPYGDSIYCFGGYDGSYLNQITRYALRFSSPEPTTSVGSEQIPRLITTIFSPLNQTYFVSNFEFRFKAESTVQQNFIVRAWLNNNLEYENLTYQNNTNVVFFRNLSDGLYNFTVLANTLTNVSISTIFFTILNHTIRNINITPPSINELENFNLSLSIEYNIDMYRSLNYSIFLDNTSVIINKSSAGNGTHFFINETLISPLTNITRNYTINISLTFTLLNSSLITYNYNFTHQVNRSIFCTFNNIYDRFGVSGNITERIPSFLFLNCTNATNRPTMNLTLSLTNTTLINISSLYNTTLTFPFIPNYFNFTHPTFNITTLANLTVLYRFLNFSKIEFYQRNTTQHLALITNCSYASSIRTLSIFGFDETNRNNITATLNYSYVRIDVLDVNKTFEFVNTTGLCIYPQWAFYNTYVTAHLRRDGYTLSEYYPYTITYLSNISQSISLYLLPNALSTPVIFSVPGENYILLVERQYGTSFIFVKSSRSDFNQRAVVFLQPYDTFYRVTLFTNNLSLCYQSNDFKITMNEYSITSCRVANQTNVSLPIDQYTDLFGNEQILITCRFDANTKILTCDFITRTGLDHNVTMLVWREIKPFNRTLYYRNSTRAVSGAFSVPLVDGYQYTYEIYAMSRFSYLRDTINLFTSTINKNFIMAISFIFLLTAVTFFIHPLLGLMFSIVSLTILNIAGVVASREVIISLIILISFAIISTYMRRGET